MGGAIPPLHHVAWHLVKRRDNLTLPEEFYVTKEGLPTSKAEEARDGHFGTLSMNESGTWSGKE
jgi:hypothetical protein